jgi:hypothetical protein
VSASIDCTVKIWDTSTGSLQQIIEGNGVLIRPIAFSHDSKLLASTSGDRTVKIWDTSTGSLQQLVEVNEYISGLLLDSTISSLITNMGYIRVDRDGRTTLSNSSQDGSSNNNPKGLGISGSWITLNAQNLLRLPPGFRTVAYNISPSMSIAAVGCLSGKVFLINFSLADFKLYFGQLQI